MQTIKPMALGLSTRCIEYRKRRGLSVSATAYFSFKDGADAALWTEMGMWKFLASEMAVPVIDEGILKTVPEFLVYGHACAPGGESPAFAVRAQVGGREKTLLAFGDRYWDGNQPSPPKPFQRMRVDWGRAYGGADFPMNPLGRGRVRESLNGVAVQPLPNLELPQQRLLSPTQAVAPAGFGFVDPMWPQRAQYRGTYDENWLKEHSPGFAPDLNWRHFNIAPEDQWFDGPLQGDEAFAFENLHPEKPTVHGKLPNVRARVFCDVRAEGGSKFREVAMRLTTLWFFPHAERGVMIFQGLCDIEEDDAADVYNLMGALERNGEPRPDEHYLEVMRKRLDPHYGALHALRESDLLPAGISGSDPEFEEVQNDYKLKGHMADAAFRRAELQVAFARDQVQAQGMDPDLLKITMPVREKPPELEELPAYIEKKLAEAVEEQKKILPEVATQVAKAKTAAQAAGVDLAALEQRGPPTYAAAAHLKELQSSVAAGAQAADGTPLLDLAAIAPQLQKVEAAHKVAYLLSAHLQAPAPAALPEAAALMKEAVVKAHRAGLNFRGADLTGADLSNLDLRRADFRYAHMESVNLSGANVSFADFSGAVLAHANLGGTVAIRSTLRGANLGKALVPEAVFDHADLNGAILSHVDFSRTSFCGADLSNANLLEATYGPADWSGVKGAALNFLKADLTGMVLQEGHLAGANFVECKLDGVNLAGADLSGVNFITCSGLKTRLAGARLVQAVFVKGCDFSDADFSGATMSSCNLRGTVLKRCRLATARLDAADCSEACMSGSDLQNVSAQGALFIKTDLRDVRASGINLMNAVVSKADLRGADLQSANLYGSDLSRVHADSATRFDGSVSWRARTFPRRPPDVAPSPAA